MDWSVSGSLSIVYLGYLARVGRRLDEIGRGTTSIVARARRDDFVVLTPCPRQRPGELDLCLFTAGRHGLVRSRSACEQQHERLDVAGAVPICNTRNNGMEGPGNACARLFMCLWYAVTKRRAAEIHSNGGTSILTYRTGITKPCAPFVRVNDVVVHRTGWRSLRWGGARFMRPRGDAGNGVNLGSRLPCTARTYKMGTVCSMTFTTHHLTDPAICQA